MSTNITSIDGDGRHAGISARRHKDKVFVYLSDARSLDVGVERGEFLAAVAAECGVIIIDRNDLPDVADNGTHYTVGQAELWPKTAATRVGASKFRGSALDSLAIAEYLDAHPPVDEADVEALADVLAEFDARDRIARALLASGRIEVKK